MQITSGGLSSPTLEFWFALQVAPQHERRVVAILAYKGFQQFCPTYQVRRRWSDRSKVVTLPLFPGYVFCRSPRRHFSVILATPGVNRIVGFGGGPYPVPDAEIKALQTIITAGADPRPYSYLTAGQKCRIIEEGALYGIEGILTTIKNQTRLVISVDLITKSISIEVDHRAVCPVDAPASHRRYQQSKVS